jgi:hypothetical protein
MELKDFSNMIGASMAKDRRAICTDRRTTEFERERDSGIQRESFQKGFERWNQMISDSRRRGGEWRMGWKELRCCFNTEERLGNKVLVNSSARLSTTVTYKWEG